MKKILIVILTTLTFFSLTGCGKEKTTTKANKSTVELLESDLEKQICDIAEFLDSATFCVLNYATTESENASSLGSGVVYKREINDNNSYTYYLVTNRHVIEDGEKFKVYTTSGSTITANRLGYSETYDIGVLTFTAFEKYNVVSFADAEDIKQGEMCFAMGTPLYMSYVNTFTQGNVSALRDDRIQHTADINAGNSGGPLVDINGLLIGINVSKLSNNQMSQPDIDGMCFAIKIDKVEKAINEIEGKEDAVVNPLLGMTVTDVSSVRLYNYDTFDDFWNELKAEFMASYQGRYSDEYLEQYFEDNYGSKKEDYRKNYLSLHAFNTYLTDDMNSGMLIRNIVADSVVDKAGLEIGDVVVNVDGSTVTKQSDFTKVFYQKAIGDSLQITVNRGGEAITVNVTL